MAKPNWRMVLASGTLAGVGLGGFVLADRAVNAEPVDPIELGRSVGSRASLASLDTKWDLASPDTTDGAEANPDQLKRGLRQGSADVARSGRGSAAGPNVVRPALVTGFSLATLDAPSAPSPGSVNAASPASLQSLASAPSATSVASVASAEVAPQPQPQPQPQPHQPAPPPASWDSVASGSGGGSGGWSS